MNGLRISLWLLNEQILNVQYYFGVLYVPTSIGRWRSEYIKLFGILTEHSERYWYALFVMDLLVWLVVSFLQNTGSAMQKSLMGIY
jgi:hypothetical protein